MLQCVLTVNDGARKTQRALKAAYPGKYTDEDRIKIGERDYSLTVMESDYDEGYQISADEGQIVLHEYLTYGYGETVAVDDMLARIAAVKAWAEEAKGPHGFTYEIRIGVNYW
jgi:hypothetical protein